MIGGMAEDRSPGRPEKVKIWGPRENPVAESDNVVIERKRWETLIQRENAEITKRRWTKKNNALSIGSLNKTRPTQTGSLKGAKRG